MMLHHLYKCSNNHDLQLDDLLKTYTTKNAIILRLSLKPLHDNSIIVLDTPFLDKKVDNQKMCLSFLT